MPDNTPAPTAAQLERLHELTTATFIGAEYLWPEDREALRAVLGRLQAVEAENERLRVALSAIASRSEGAMLAFLFSVGIPPEGTAYDLSDQVARAALAAGEPGEGGA
jgi:hypothetical protein